MPNAQPPGGAQPESTAAKKSTAARKSAPPERAKPNDTWTDEFGELYTFDGKDWVPFEDATWFAPNSPFRQ